MKFIGFSNVFWPAQCIFLYDKTLSVIAGEACMGKTVKIHHGGTLVADGTIPSAGLAAAPTVASGNLTIHDEEFVEFAEGETYTITIGDADPVNGYRLSSTTMTTFDFSAFWCIYAYNSQAGAVTGRSDLAAAPYVIAKTNTVTTKKYDIKQLPDECLPDTAARAADVAKAEAVATKAKRAADEAFNTASSAVTMVEQSEAQEYSNISRLFGTPIDWRLDEWLPNSFDSTRTYLSNAINGMVCYRVRTSTLIGDHLDALVCSGYSKTTVLYSNDPTVCTIYPIEVTMVVGVNGAWSSKQETYQLGECYHFTNSLIDEVVLVIWSTMTTFNLDASIDGSGNVWYSAPSPGVYWCDLKGTAGQSSAYDFRRTGYGSTLPAYQLGKHITYGAQTLTDAQKQQARTNIGAGTSSFSGSYNDLTDKPTDVIVPSSTDGSTKKFKITVDDSGTISATEVTT